MVPGSTVARFGCLLLVLLCGGAGRPASEHSSGTSEGDAGGGPGQGSEGRGRVVVIGIDGADWRVIRPLVESGPLTHFKRLVEEGATGTLRSMEPSASPSLWTTVTTGVKPERHGIHGFVVEAGGGPQPGPPPGFPTPCRTRG